MGASVDVLHTPIVVRPAAAPPLAAPPAEALPVAAPPLAAAVPRRGAFVRFLRAVGIALLSFIGLAAIVIAATGIIYVSVQEKQPGGVHLRLPVPAVLVPIALEFVPQNAWREPAMQAKPYLPLMKVAAAELARCPDGDFVEVKDAQQHVIISKSGRSLVINVDTPDEQVHVSVPIGVLSSVTNQLERAARTETTNATN